MIKKSIILGFACALLGNVYAQTVGINTENPTSELDVNGSVRTIDNLLVGGDDATPGSAGTAGQFLISQGAGVAPEWQTVNSPIPDTGDWYLLGSISRVDTKGGMRFTTNQKSDATSYADNYTLYPTTDNATTGYWNTSRSTTSTSATKPWQEFSDFTLELPAYDEPIRVVFNIQVLVQADVTTHLTSDPWMSYAIAIFSDNMRTGNGNNGRAAVMLASRQGGCYGSDTNITPQQLMTFIVSVDLPANTASRLLALGTQRNNSVPYTSCYLTIGQTLDGGNDPLVRQATMRADIYQKVTR